MPGEARAADRPATFGEVFASREYRYLFSATLLSWFGDYLAKAAVTALVFAQTRSVALSAAAFALSYLPWVAGGPLLAAIAERRPFRRIMVISDLLRAGLMCLVALPGMPVPAMLALLFAAALGNPPFEAARSAVLPQILTGDRYVVGLSLHSSTSQVAQARRIPGRRRPGALLSPAGAAAQRHHLRRIRRADPLRHGRPSSDRPAGGAPAAARRDRGRFPDGLRHSGAARDRGRRLRVDAVLIVPEGLAAAWAAELADGESAPAGGPRA